MKTVIIGAGGFGREVLALIREVNRNSQTFDIIGFLDDGIEKGIKIQDYSVLGKVEAIDESGAEAVVIAIGNSQTREHVVNLLPSSIKFPNVIHPSAQFMDVKRIKLGKGCIICAGNIFTTDIVVGDHCIVNLSCTIGHDAILQDFVSVMPGVNISGGARINHAAYIGTGAKLIKATDIGKYSIVGAGAVVDSDVDAHTTVVGIPARPLKSKHV